MHKHAHTHTHTNTQTHKRANAQTHNHRTEQRAIKSTLDPFEAPQGNVTPPTEARQPANKHTHTNNQSSIQFHNHTRMQSSKQMHTAIASTEGNWQEMSKHTLHIKQRSTKHSNA